MPVKLPTRDALSPVSSRAGGKVAGINLSERNVGASPGAIMAKGVADLGKGIGVAGEIIREHHEKDENFETERRFHEWQWEQQKKLDEASRNMQPGQAGSFAETFTKDYTDQAKEFFKTVPDRLKRQYDDRLLQTERSLYGHATTLGRNEQARYAVNSIGDMRENVYQPRARITPTSELDKVTEDHDRLIDSNPYLTPIQKDEMKRKGRREIGMSHLDELKPGQMAPIAAGRTGQHATPDGLIRKFEGFREQAYFDVNAYRAGYGSDTVTRADGTVEKVTKDTRVTREDAERDLARRTGEFSQIAAEKVGPDRWNALPANVKAALTSVTYNYGKLPDSVAQAVQSDDPAVIANAVRSLPANPKRRAQEAAVIMGSSGLPSALSSLTDEDWQRIEARQQQKQVKVAAERSEFYERNIIDAKAGTTDLFARKQLEQDPDLDEPRRNTLLRQYDEANKDVVKTAKLYEKFVDPNGGPFNPFDTDERKGVDKIYQQLGGDETALTAVIDRTGILPDSVGKTIHGSLVSNDPQRVASAAQVASNLLARNPNIFVKHEAKKEIEDTAVAFRHFTEDLGFTAEEAGKRIVETQSPEYQSKIKGHIKAEDIRAILKKQTTDGTLRADLAKAFNESMLPIGFRPEVAATPAARDQMLSDYKELIEENFLGSKGGDLALAKKNAAAQLKKVWGVSYVSGSGMTASGTLMRYAPEKAPAYQGIENIADRIANQALADIKLLTGKDVERKSIFLLPVLGGQTAAKYWAGEAPPYLLGWNDENGMPHYLNIGKAFVADPNKMRAEQTAERQTQFTTFQAKTQEFEARQAAAPTLQPLGEPRSFLAKARQTEQARMAEKRPKLPSRVVETDGDY